MSTVAISTGASSVRNKNVIETIKVLTAGKANLQLGLGGSLPRISALVLNFAASPHKALNSRSFSDEDIVITPLYLNSYNPSVASSSEEDFENPVAFHDVVSSLVKFTALDRDDVELSNDEIAATVLDHKELVSRISKRCVDLNCKASDGVLFEKAVKHAFDAAIIGSQILAALAHTTEADRVNDISDADFNGMTLSAYGSDNYRQKTMSVLGITPSDVIAQITSLYGYLMGNTRTLSSVDLIKPYAKVFKLISRD